MKFLPSDEWWQLDEPLVVARTLLLICVVLGFGLFFWVKSCAEDNDMDERYFAFLAQCELENDVETCREIFTDNHQDCVEIAGGALSMNEYVECVELGFSEYREQQSQ